MNRYRVIVTRDTTESITVEVTSENAERAKIAALDGSYSADYDDLWTQDYTPNASGAHYVTDVDCIAKGRASSGFPLYILMGHPDNRQQSFRMFRTREQRDAFYEGMKDALDADHDLDCAHCEDSFMGILEEYGLDYTLEQEKS